MLFPPLQQLHAEILPGFGSGFFPAALRRLFTKDRFNEEALYKIYNSFFAGCVSLRVLFVFLLLLRRFLYSPFALSLPGSAQSHTDTHTSYLFSHRSPQRRQPLIASQSGTGGNVGL